MKRIVLLISILFWSVPTFAQTVSNVVKLNANVTDTPAAGETECGVASVQFFRDTTPISPVMTAPTSGTSYLFAWDTKSVPNGTYQVTAQATDKAGSGNSPATVCDGSKPNVGTSNVLTIVVNNVASDNTKPAITITITVSVGP